MAQSPEYPDLPWMPPKSYTKGRRRGCPKAIVVHYTAGREGPTAAEDGARYDQRRTDGTSAHYYVDSNSVVQCVRTTDEAHTARSHGNDLGIHYELCGTAQTRAQWLDATSRATIRHAAQQMARDITRHGIPVRRLTVAQVRACHPDHGNGAGGICGHAEITRAFPEDKGTHTDPGSGFPWDVLASDIYGFLGSTGGGEVNQQEFKDILISAPKPAGMGGPDGAIRVADWIAWSAHTLAGLVIDIADLDKRLDDLERRPTVPTVELTPDQVRILAGALGPALVEQIAGLLERTHLDVGEPTP